MKKNQSQGNMLTAVVSASIGILAGAVAVFLSDEKNRKKVAKTAKDVQKVTGEQLTSLKQQATKKAQTIQKTAASVTKKQPEKKTTKSRVVKGRVVRKTK